MLFELLRDDSVATVYCLTRRESPLEAILDSLTAKELSVSPDQLSKVVALNTCLDQPNFGLFGDDSILQRMRESVSLIIHSAWPVNFNLSLSEFESHIHGLHNLIQFSLSVRRCEPAVLLFCSSISTALASPCVQVPEEPVDLCSALPGYGQSKLAGEHIVSNARRSGARAYSLRIGQVSGHSKRGHWNDSEALPLMIRSALTLGALPELFETCSWFPVDKLACSILELAKSCTISHGYEGDASSSLARHGDDSIFNLCNPKQFAWSTLLTALQCAGFDFKVLPIQDWLEKLRESELRGEESVNPAVKLLHHYETMYGSGCPVNSRPKKFLTTKAQGMSETMRDEGLNIIEGGVLSCYIKDWLTRWTAS